MEILQQRRQEREIEVVASSGDLLAWERPYYDRLHGTRRLHSREMLQAKNHLFYDALTRKRSALANVSFHTDYDPDVSTSRLAALTGTASAPSAAFVSEDAKQLEPSPAVKPDSVTGRGVVALYNLTSNVCGHKGLVHGGLTAAMFDETFGVVMFAHPSVPRYTFTASLTVNYRKPLPAAQTVAIVAGVERVDGRKVYMTGTLVDADGTVYADATALFVAPKPKPALASASV